MLTVTMVTILIPSQFVPTPPPPRREEIFTDGENMFTGDSAVEDLDKAVRFLCASGECGEGVPVVDVLRVCQWLMC